MYYDYYLLVMQVYDKKYGNTEFLSLYQNLHNFQIPCIGGQFFSAKEEIFSELVYFSPYILSALYFLCEIDHISPPPIYIDIYDEKRKKKYL